MFDGDKLINMEGGLTHRGFAGARNMSHSNGHMNLVRHDSDKL